MWWVHCGLLSSIQTWHLKVFRIFGPVKKCRNIPPSCDHQFQTKSWRTCKCTCPKKLHARTLEHCLSIHIWHSILLDFGHFIGNLPASLLNLLTFTWQTILKKYQGLSRVKHNWISCGTVLIIFGNIVLNLLIIGILGYDWHGDSSVGIHPNFMPSQT